jgi:hypothetical protein
MERERQRQVQEPSPGAARRVAAGDEQDQAGFEQERSGC